MQNKTAQELKKRHKARRLFNPTGKALSLLSPKFRKIITNLDRVDKRVRKEAEDLNYYIGMAKSFFRRKDYLSAATYLREFHEKAKLIHHHLNTFSGSITPNNRRYLLQQFKGKDKKRLLDYDPNKEIEAPKLVDDGQPEMLAMAGAFKDWWRVPGRFSDLTHNLTDSKSKAMRALENRFSDEFLISLKEDTKEMLDTTSNFYKGLLSNFHDMGAAWGGRNVGAYLKEISEINGEYKDFHTAYVKYHTDHIVPLNEEQKKLNMEEEERAKEKAQKTEEKTKQMQEIVPDKLNSFQGPDLAGPSASFSPAPGSEYSSEPTTVKRPAEPSFRGFESGALPSPITQRSPTLQQPTPPLSIQPTVPTNRNFPAPPANQPDSEPFSFNAPPGKDLSHVEHLMDAEPFELRKRKANEEFIRRIEKLSTDDEIIREILTYSEMVEQFSEEDSLKLLSVAEGLIEKQSAAKKKTIEQPAPPSEPPPSSDPETELLDNLPDTQRSSELQPTPEKRNQPDAAIQENRHSPVQHGIPQGHINKKWSDFPYLAKIKPERIQISPGAMDMISKKMTEFFHHQLLPYRHIGMDKFISAIQKSITVGSLVSNFACGGEHNSQDCQLDIHCRVPLDSIDSSPAFEDVELSFNATCRLSLFRGSVVVRNIRALKVEDFGDYEP